MKLKETIDRYYKLRGLARPGTVEAMLFLTSEIGELSDAIVSTLGGWVRNNKEKENTENNLSYIADEIGDVLMMLTVVADAYELDPYDCMVNKMTKKVGGL